MASLQELEIQLHCRVEGANLGQALSRAGKTSSVKHAVVLGLDFANAGAALGCLQVRSILPCISLEAGRTHASQ